MDRAVWGSQYIHLEPSERAGFARMMQGSQFFREIGENCWDAEVRKREYAALETQVQVVCTIPVMFNYDAPRRMRRTSRASSTTTSVRWSPMIRGIMRACARYMQDTDAAILELERAKDAGRLGVQIGSNINGLNLSEERFFPFFEACRAWDGGHVTVGHDGQGAGGKILVALVGRHACGNGPCGKFMIFGGVLERLPNLRVMFSHAGGSFLTTLGRFEHGFNCRPDLVAVDNDVNPRDYLGKFWIDSITHDADLLKYVLKLQGANRICMGSDYPFPLGDLELGAYMLDMGLEEDQLNQLFSGAALEWLGVPASHFES